MLEFCKKVLEKTEELEVLRRWCLIKFGSLYRSLIEDSFKNAIPA